MTTRAAPCSAESAEICALLREGLATMAEREREATRRWRIALGVTGAIGLLGWIGDVLPVVPG